MLCTDTVRNLIKSSLVDLPHSIECVKPILEVFYTNTCRKAMKSRMGRMCKPNMGWSNGSISRRLDHDIWYLHLCICVFVYLCICILYLWYLHLESVVFVFVWKPNMGRSNGSISRQLNYDIKIEDKNVLAVSVFCKTLKCLNLLKFTNFLDYQMLSRLKRIEIP